MPGRRSNDEWLRDPKRINFREIPMGLKKRPLATENLANLAIRAVGIMELSRLKNIEKSHEVKVVPGEMKEKLK